MPSYAQLLLYALELVLHVLAEPEVERAERLVKQQDLRAVHERAGNRDALLLAAGELVGLTLFKALEGDNLQHLGDALLYLLRRQLGYAQAEGDVLKHVQMGKERVLLEHRVDAALVGRDIINPHTVKEHVAARRLQKAADDAQRCRLTAAGRAEKCEEFAVVKINVDRVKDGLAVKVHPAVYKPYEFFGHYPPPLCFGVRSEDGARRLSGIFSALGTAALVFFSSIKHRESPLSDGTDDYGS